MKIRGSKLSAIVAGSLCALCAGAGVAQSNAATSQLRMYTFGDLTPSRYEVVGRQWGDSWRSAFWGVPTFATREQALAALQTEAARTGADGLLNVYCLDQGRAKWSSNTEPAFLCYGIAIRVRPAQG
jgi:hypothetical protein